MILNGSLGGCYNQLAATERCLSPNAVNIAAPQKIFAKVCVFRTCCSCCAISHISLVVNSTAAADREKVVRAHIENCANKQRLTVISGATVMPQFDSELIQVMKKVLEDIMTRVPLEHSTPAAKAYLAECILKAAAQGQTNYDALIVAAADQIEVFISLFS